MSAGSTRARKALQFMMRATLTAGFAVVATGALAQILDGNGVAYPDNPIKKDVACSAAEANGWGLPGTMASPQLYTLNVNQTVAQPRFKSCDHDTDDTTPNQRDAACGFEDDNRGEIYIPRPCDEDGDPISTGTYTLVETSATTPTNLTGNIADRANGGIVGMTLVAPTFPTNDPLTDDDKISDGYRLLYNISGTAEEMDADDTAKNKALVFNYKLSWDSGVAGQDLRHFYFRVTLKKQPLTSPIINTARAESSKNVHVEIDRMVGSTTNASLLPASGTFYVEVKVTDSKGKTLGSNKTKELTSAQLSSRDFEMDVELSDDTYAEEAISATVTAYVKQKGAGAPADGVSETKSITIPKGPEMANLQVGEVPAEGANFTGHRVLGYNAGSKDSKLKYVFESKSIAERLVTGYTHFGSDLGSTSDDVVHTLSGDFAYNWTVSSSDSSVATVTLDADEDGNVDDDTLTIKGVYTGSNDMGKAYITVKGKQNTANPLATSPADTTFAVIAEARSLKEVILVTVLKNRVPIFNVTAATIRWVEDNGDVDQSVDLTAKFVRTDLLEDPDTMQKITFAFVGSNDKAMTPKDYSESDKCAANNNAASAMQTRSGPFYLTEDGKYLGVVLSGENCDSHGVNFEDDETHALTVHASDGAGGADTLALTIDVRDRNDLPTRTKATKDAGVILEKDPKPKQVDLSSGFFKDEDLDKLCYTMTPPAATDPSSKFASVSQSGPAACKNANFTITMKLPSVEADTPDIGHTGVESYSFEVTAKEAGQKTPATEAVTVSVKLVYGQNLGPQIWGGRQNSPVNQDKPATVRT